MASSEPASFSTLEQGNTEIPGDAAHPLMWLPFLTEIRFTHKSAQDFILEQSVERKHDTELSAKPTLHDHISLAVSSVEQVKGVSRGSGLWYWLVDRCVKRAATTLQSSYDILDELKRVVSLPVEGPDTRSLIIDDSARRSSTSRTDEWLASYSRSIKIDHWLKTRRVPHPEFGFLVLMACYNTAPYTIWQLEKFPMRIETFLVYCIACIFGSEASPLAPWEENGFAPLLMDPFGKSIDFSYRVEGLTLWFAVQSFILGVIKVWRDGSSMACFDVLDFAVGHGAELDAKVIARSSLRKSFFYNKGWNGSSFLSFKRSLKDLGVREGPAELVIELSCFTSMSMFLNYPFDSQK